MYSEAHVGPLCPEYLEQLLMNFVLLVAMTISCPSKALCRYGTAEPPVTRPSVWYLSDGFIVLPKDGNSKVNVPEVAD